MLCKTVEAAAAAAITAGGGPLTGLEEVLRGAELALGRRVGPGELQAELARKGWRGLARRVECCNRARRVCAHPDVSLAAEVRAALAVEACPTEEAASASSPEAYFIGNTEEDGSEAKQEEEHEQAVVTRHSPRNALTAKNEFGAKQQAPREQVVQSLQSLQSLPRRST